LLAWLQHQSFFAADQPVCQLAKPATQSKGFGPVGGQPLASLLQHQSFLATDQATTQLLKASLQSKSFETGVPGCGAAVAGTGVGGGPITSTGVVGWAGGCCVTSGCGGAGGFGEAGLSTAGCGDCCTAACNAGPGGAACSEPSLSVSAAARDGQRREYSWQQACSSSSVKPPHPKQSCLSRG